VIVAQWLVIKRDQEAQRFLAQGSFAAAAAQDQGVKAR